METILRNLLSNAIKFSYPKGAIGIKAMNKGSETEIFISDQGVGMSRDDVVQVFQSKRTQSRSGTNNEKGTGIGLLIVKEFVTRHHGAIRVNSKVDKGSEFIISIPSESLNDI